MILPPRPDRTSFTPTLVIIVVVSISLVVVTGGVGDDVFDVLEAASLGWLATYVGFDFFVGPFSGASSWSLRLDATTSLEDALLAYCLASFSD